MNNSFAAGSMALPRPLMEGALKRLGFSDLLQSLSHGDPCQVLLLAGDQVKGVLWLAGKQVIRVRTPKAHGESAFVELFEDGNRGGFRVFPLPWDKIPPEETVGDLGALLVNAAWAVDEARRPHNKTVKLPDSSFSGKITQTSSVNVREIIDAIERRSVNRGEGCETAPGVDLQATVRLNTQAVRNMKQAEGQN